MSGQARTAGGILLGAGLVVTLVAYNWLLAARAAGDLLAGGFSLGLFLVVAVTLPVMAGGIYLLLKGSSEIEDYRRTERMKQMLGMVLTQGKVRVSDIMVELGMPRDEVQAMLYEAVSKGLFSGYVNWREGILYAADAVQGEQTCPVCGGTIEIAGRGAFECPYCQTELLRGTGDEKFHVIRGIQPPAEWAAGGAKDALPGAAVAGAAADALPGGAEAGAAGGTSDEATAVTGAMAQPATAVDRPVADTDTPTAPVHRTSSQASEVEERTSSAER